MVKHSVEQGLQEGLTRLAFAAVVTTAMSGAALAQKVSISDAQVEANVIKGLAADTSLANEPIQSSTAFGVVTLTGAVQNNGARDRAEQIASHTEGVKKVVDQLAVGAGAVKTASTATPQQASAQPGAQNESVAQNQASAQNQADYDPASVNTLPEGEAGGPVNGNQQPVAQTNESVAVQNQQAQQNQQALPAQQGYPLPGQGDGAVGSQPNGYPQQQGGYNNQQGQYPQQGGYNQQQGQYPQAGAQPAPRMYRRDWERQQALNNGNQQGQYQGQPGQYQGQPGQYQGQSGQYQGQPGGQAVTVPAGVVLPVRITRWVDSHDAQAGSQFTAVVNTDILAGGLIAIPRGAEVQGTVVEAKGAGVLKGRGELVLQLNTLNLGGRQIPLVSDTFDVKGHDKTARSVNSTIIGGAVGALFGAAIGGGEGAAIGAGVGGAAGLGTAAASRSGNVDIPAEALLQFRLSAPLPLTTVSEAEMQRLGSYAGPQGARRPAYGYPPPPPPYYYGRPYRGYHGY